MRRDRGSACEGSHAEQRQSLARVVSESTVQRRRARLAWRLAYDLLRVVVLG